MLIEVPPERLWCSSLRPLPVVVLPSRALFVVCSLAGRRAVCLVGVVCVSPCLCLCVCLCPIVYFVCFAGADILVAAGVALVRDVVQRREQGAGEDYRSLQQSSGFFLFFCKKILLACAWSLWYVFYFSDFVLQQYQIR